eukprot:TRINITY_DN3578_c0_g1_i3.p1 TRINITY_DN3578_c0_g1~~TRINITY_DN3578_c0_g1_i3.p1  ORF type:complete len:239 (+),score=43.16 TRINITY_DN3578_c0_g1_i3:162-878(+)
MTETTATTKAATIGQDKQTSNEEEEDSIILVNKPHPEGLVFEEFKQTNGNLINVALVKKVDLTNNKLSNKIGSLEVLVNLESLVLRHNFLSNTSLDDILRVSSTLRELDLYDNQITNFYSLPLSSLTNLTTLDVSFNHIKRLGEVEDTQELAKLINLKELAFANNKIKQIQPPFPSLSSLTSLELGANRLREIKGLEALVHLRSLWLGKNKITKIANLEALTELRCLSLQVLFCFLCL